MVKQMNTVSGKNVSALQRGYTLLEMAIVMAVIGVLIASFANAYNIYLKNTVQRVTVDNTNQIVNAIGHYLVQNGRYPCPSRLDAGRDDPDYGMEGDCTDTTVAVGQCANGICVEEGDRTVNINPNPGGTTIDLLQKSPLDSQRNQFMIQ